MASWPEAEPGADATLREGSGSTDDAVGQLGGGTILPVKGCNPDGTRTSVSALDGTTGWCNITGIALNVSLRDYEVPEILATPTPLPLTLELAEARARGLAQVAATGQGLE